MNENINVIRPLTDSTRNKDETKINKKKGHHKSCYL